MITQEDVMKVQEIAELHDEAFWHLHQFDGHAKSSDGGIEFYISFGNVWSRRGGPVAPTVGVGIYSYVVASETPSYPNFGDRNHYFDNLDQALEVMREWHAKAMSYNPSEQELKEIDDFAKQMWESIKDKVTILEVDYKSGEKDD
jgi:hypothetical protein